MMSRPRDIPEEVWDQALDITNDALVSFQDAMRHWDGPRLVDEIATPIARAILNAAAQQREWDAQVISDDSGEFIPPDGYRQALREHADDVNDEGMLVVAGDERVWSSFFREMLKPFAAAVRKSSFFQAARDS